MSIISLKHNAIISFYDEKEMKKDPIQDIPTMLHQRNSVITLLTLQ